MLLHNIQCKSGESCQSHQRWCVCTRAANTSSHKIPHSSMWNFIVGTSRKCVFVNCNRLQEVMLAAMPIWSTKTALSLHSATNEAECSENGKTEEWKNMEMKIWKTVKSIPHKTNKVKCRLCKAKLSFDDSTTAVHEYLNAGTLELWRPLQPLKRSSYTAS